MESGAGVMMWRMGYVHNAEMIKIASSAVTEYCYCSSPNVNYKFSPGVQQSLNQRKIKIVEPHANNQHAQRESLFYYQHSEREKTAFLSHPKESSKASKPLPPPKFPKSNRKTMDATIQPLPFPQDFTLT